ncbi:hypothetical protein QQX98_011489 [Neonectria punicea]|uniref:Methyltransferase n=1 Tax=Neonectria punicea TaxID=979145 RepID=A0ABR1GLZ8_9HYPO
MTTNDEPIQTNEDTLEGWLIVGASATSPGPPLGQLPVEVSEHQEREGDDGDSDDSGFGSRLSSIDSITPSVCDYPEIHGRMYHSDMWNTGYCFPIDQRQLEAQLYSDIAVFMLLGEDLHLADLKTAEKQIQRVLDIGSGRGYWAIEFADTYPNTEVIGTDLSPIGIKWVAPNLCFQIEDCRQDWTFDDSRFDFIHMRHLVGGIKDWRHLYREAFRCTSPGGLVESHERSFIFKSDKETIEPESALGRMGDIFREAGVKSGYSFAVVDEGTQRKGMEEAGFVDIKEEVKRMPIRKEREAPIPQDIGGIAHEAFTHDLEGYLLLVTTQVLGWTIVETYLLAMEVREQLEQMDVYVDHKIVVGQKPLSSSD